MFVSCVLHCFKLSEALWSPVCLVFTLNLLMFLLVNITFCLIFDWQEAQENLQEAKALLDVLQHQAHSLTNQTKQPVEKQQVTATITNLQTQVITLGQAVSQKVTELTEAVALWEDHHEALESVSVWLAEGVSITEPNLVMTNPQIVHSQLDAHQVCLCSLYKKSLLSENSQIKT